MKKVTIITVVRNSEDQITNTLLSVINQTYSDIEYIVIDGKSTDSTFLICEKYKNKISKLIRESDKGIYDAMNKGIKLATGDWIAFLNAGETYLENTTIEKLFKEDVESSDLIYGMTCNYYEDLDFLGYVTPDNLKQSPKRMVFDHEALFTRSTVLKSHLFNLQYSLAADYEFIFDCYLRGLKFKYIPMPVVKHRYGVGGASESSRVKSAYQRWVINRKHRRDFFLDIYYILEIVNTFTKGIARKILPYSIQKKLFKLKYQLKIKF